MTPGTPETQRQRDASRQQWATCGGCPARWTSKKVAHCRACHVSFTTVANFDKHRSRSGEHGSCLDPASVGLVERDGVWGMPGDPANTERLQKLRANTVIQAVGDTEERA